MFCLQGELFLTQSVNIIQNKIHDIAWPFLFVQVGHMQCPSRAFNQLNSQHVFLKQTLEQYLKSQLVPFLSFLNYC
jgi:hypothetical protein